jgi:sortase A
MGCQGGSARRALNERAGSDFGVRISGGMKKYNVHSSRARNVISWVLSLIMIVAGAALIASFFLAGRLDSTATNSDNPGGFNVPKLETTNDENTSSTGPSDKTLELTVPTMARIEDDEVPYTAGNDEEALKTHAAIHLEGTGFPWDNEANVYIAGHRLGYPNTESWLTFWDLSNVVGGDKIYVTDANGTEYTYNVFKTFVVSPSNLRVTETLPGKNILTLQSCTLPDYGKRLIVQAELTDTSEKAA